MPVLKVNNSIIVTKLIVGSDGLPYDPPEVRATLDEVELEVTRVSPGVYRVEIDATGLAPGMYTVRFSFVRDGEQVVLTEQLRKR